MPAWDKFLEACPDAWFSHTSAWRAYAKEYVGVRHLADLSFFLVENGEPIAACPAALEQGTPFDGSARQLGLSGGAVPFPAFLGDLGGGDRQRAIRAYVAALDAIAAEHGVAYVRVRREPFPFSSAPDGLPVANPLVREGFIELPFLTQVVDLRRDLDALWADLRKGHRIDVKRAAQAARAVVWDAATLDAAKFREYQALHAKDAGRVTRSQRTFDLMRAWVHEGQAVLLEAKHQGKPAAFALLIAHRGGAYYASACKDPDLSKLPAQHLLQWEAIRWLKAQGFHYYDVGLQQFGPQWFDQPTKKEMGIAHFKRGFGGSTVSVPIAERHYDSAHLRGAFTTRFHAYLGSGQGA